MRYSKQRNLILNILQGTRSHPTADWIYGEVRRILPNVSLGTVYRNLGQLVDNKSLEAINIDGTVHYDAFLDDHQHFQCNTCNQIFDIDLNTKDFVLKFKSKIKHKIDRWQIHFYGICELCQKN